MPKVPTREHGMQQPRQTSQDVWMIQNPSGDSEIRRSSCRKRMELAREISAGRHGTCSRSVADGGLAALLVSQTVLPRSWLLPGWPPGAPGGRDPAARARSNHRSRNEVISDRA